MNSESPVRLRLMSIVAFLLVTLAPLSQLEGWGYNAHKRINFDAVDTLPVGLRHFFVENREFISEHASDPDKWRKDDKEESPHHYIDLDLYGPYPFDQIPIRYEEATAKYTEERVKASGTVPWRIDEYTKKLAGAMKAGDKNEILITAAALGHYVADTHMPLHTVENYNGQLTGNKGVHGQFESVMVDAHLAEYDFAPYEAEPIDDPLSYAFGIAKHSYTLALAVLKADAAARAPLAENLQDSIATWRAAPVDEYVEALYELAGETAWKQIDLATRNVGRYWMTAWLIAGKPQLPE